MHQRRRSFNLLHGDDATLCRKPQPVVLSRIAVGVKTPQDGP
jgi:hypothetical protein